MTAFLSFSFPPDSDCITGREERGDVVLSDPADLRRHAADGRARQKEMISGQPDLPTRAESGCSHRTGNLVENRDLLQRLNRTEGRGMFGDLPGGAEIF
ncbi:uncharacterized [Tachysurus ichikawai]